MNAPHEQPLQAAYDVALFCRVYCVGKTKAYEEIKAGRLPAKKLGRSTLILRADADAWAQQLAPLHTQKKRAGAPGSSTDPLNPSHQKREG